MGKYFKTKYIFLFFALLAVVAAVGLSSHYAWRSYQKTLRMKPIPNAQIAFVNLTRIHNEATAFIKLRELIERQYKDFKNEISAQEKEILDQHTTLEQQKNLKAKEIDELQRRKEDLDKKMREMSSVIHERKTALHQNFAKITDNIESTIREIVNSLAKKHELNLIFNATVMDASVVLYGGDELDITDEVLTQLNREIPTVHLEL